MTWMAAWEINRLNLASLFSFKWSFTFNRAGIWSHYLIYYCRCLKEPPLVKATKDFQKHSPFEMKIAILHLGQKWIFWGVGEMVQRHSLREFRESKILKRKQMPLSILENSIQGFKRKKKKKDWKLENSCTYNVIKFTFAWFRKNSFH